MINQELKNQKYSTLWEQHASNQNVLDSKIDYFFLYFSPDKDNSK